MNIATDKSTLRAWGHAARRARPDKDRASAAIHNRLATWPAYQKARTILFYVDARHEVRTRAPLAEALASDKRVAVPWCHDSGELELVQLEALADLTPGRYGIAEPRDDLRQSNDRRIEPEELDLVLVPGVAFDTRGGRLGHGLGYYDKLLARLRNDCLRVALAYECQITEQVPIEAHDALMDAVITEERTILCG